MTHLVYKGELLDHEQKEAVRTWLHETQPNYLTFLIAFEAESPLYPGKFLLCSKCQSKDMVQRHKKQK